MSFEMAEQLPADRIGTAERALRRNFSLMRWFSILSLVTILIAGSGMAVFLTHFLTSHMLMRDAEVSREFIESIVRTENSSSRADGALLAWAPDVLDRFVQHLPTLPDVVGVNLYAPDQTVLWSSESHLVGQRLGDNNELERALLDEPVVSSGVVAARDGKEEHVWLKATAAASAGKRFVELYLPIRDPAGQRVIAVAEIYKLPKALFHAIDEGVRLVWISAAIMGLLLYTALFWIVRRADLIMRDQGERLVQAETLSVVGEMAAAVAHSIRNPLSSIRSAAELAFEEDESVVHRCLHNITSQADRIDEWLRELLAACRGGLVPIEKIDLNVILRDTIAGASADIKRRRIELKVIATSLPAVRGTRAPLAHAIRSVISNAVEAMPGGGILRVESRAEDGEAQIVIEDSGIGMAPEVARKAFRPLFTTKPNGVGLGLALARRILERHAGRIELHSAVGQGTRVTLNLPLET